MNYDFTSSVLVICWCLAPLLGCHSDSASVSNLSSSGWLSPCSPPVFLRPLLGFSSHLAGFLLRQHYSQMINNLENSSEPGDGLIPVEKEQLGGQKERKGPLEALYPQQANAIPHLDHCWDVQNSFPYRHLSSWGHVTIS